MYYFGHQDIKVISCRKDVLPIPLHMHKQSILTNIFTTIYVHQVEAFITINTQQCSHNSLFSAIHVYAQLIHHQVILTQFSGLRDISLD